LDLIKDKVTRHASEMYNQYRFGFFSYGEKRLNTEPLLKTFIDQIDRSKKVYDIGCGRGFWADIYLKNGIKKENLYFLDLASKNVEELKTRGFNAVCGSVLDLPMKDDCSDFTICNGVIHHTNDPSKAFTELVRITKDGGKIYLNVYNIYNPYFFIAHKLTFPLRYAYWNWNKKIVDYIYPVSKLFFQPLSYIIFGEFLDDKTGKTMLMDQVFTPRAYLFSKRLIKKYCNKLNCAVETTEYNKSFMMISAIIKVNKLSR
jgi:SAM-dependent methyltransferase